ncbi:matrixin family metalloprotease [Flavitalea flava]
MSDYRLRTEDRIKFEHRIRTVVLHEIGHNMGLTHCPNAHCIMNDANEKISSVDNSSNELCERCHNKL